jgi:hypothetical protein
MQIAGGSADTFSRAMTLMQVKLVEAVENADSKSRRAAEPGQRQVKALELDRLHGRRNESGLTDIPDFFERILVGVNHMGDGAARVGPPAALALR